MDGRSPEQRGDNWGGEPITPPDASLHIFVATGRSTQLAPTTSIPSLAGSIQHTLDVTPKASDQADIISHVTPSPFIGSSPKQRNP